MKALILALLSLSVLAGCAHYPFGEEDQSKRDRDLPPAAKGFCNANDGVFVILLGTDGVKKEHEIPGDTSSPLVMTGFACPTVGKGGPPITQPEVLPDGLTQVKPIDLGVLEKFAIPNDPDPCYVWKIGGKKYHVCW